MRSLEIPVGPFAFRARASGPEDGELVLLLHGFPQCSAEWNAQLGALGAAGLRAVAPDQRGYSPGARPEGVDAYRIEHLVGDVLDVADALGARRFHLVGHDWGAIVAWHVAAHHPERLRSLAIVSVPHPNAFARALAPGSGSDQLERSGYIAGFQQAGAEDAMDEAFLRMAFEASGLAGHDVEDHVRVLTEPGAMRAALSWYRAYDFHAQSAPAIAVPTLFVWSTEDPALGRDGAEWTAEHVTGPYRFVVVEGGPHWLPETHADEVSRLLLAHVAANAGA
ncbi:MAG: alpha/beta hydrolase [Myxococcales bacterium]|nr:alpha/beta hydrolase [Myxococcales bacterium]